MRILIYGAGNIGCLYAARLAQSGQDVTILARGERYNSLRDLGVTLVDEVSQARTETTIPVVDHLSPQAAFDFVLVALPNPALAEALPELAANPHTPSVMFFGNNASGPERMVEALGRDRVLLGFPGAAAIPDEGAIRYVVTSPREQPTTVGELDGSHSERITAFAQVMKHAGFPATICSDMDAWLKTHAAKILPTAGALFYAGGTLEELIANNEAIRLLVRAMRECLNVLIANDVPITPSNHRVLRWLPETLVVFIMKRMLAVKTMAIKLGHAHHARQELRALTSAFQAMNATTQVPTPAMDVLCAGLDQLGCYRNAA